MDCLFFDFDDTIYDQAQPFADAYRDVLGNRFGLDPVALFSASRNHSEAVFEASERGELSMDEMYIYRIQHAFADFGCHVDADECLAMQHAYAHNQEHAITIPETMQKVLDWSRDHTRPGIISNGPAEHQLAKMEVVGIERWIARDAIFISSVVGVAKPDPRIFEMACEHFGTTPGRCVYVGDSFDADVVGAHAIGMPVIWYNRRQRTAKRLPVPTWEVRSEEALLELLPQL